MGAVRWSERALLDLAELAEFIRREDPVAVARVVDEFEVALERLSDAPELGRPRPELSDAPDLRSWPVRSWLVFFRAHARGLEVVRILHGRRDLGRLLGPR